MPMQYCTICLPNGLLSSNGATMMYDEVEVPLPRPSFYFFFGPNMGAPILVPVSLTLAAFWILFTKSMAGQSAPGRSRAVMNFTSTDALAARSFWVMVPPFAFFMLARACWRALATSSGTFLVATMSSDRSTLVRCWPSPPFCAAWR